MPITNLSFHQIRVEGAFLVSSELKDGEIIKLSIFCEQGRVLNLLNLCRNRKIKVTVKDSNKKVHNHKAGNIFTSPLYEKDYTRTTRFESVVLGYLISVHKQHTNRQVRRRNVSAEHRLLFELLP
ncbi:MAG: hypothetical protein LBG58_09380 [Planctomycetaceae bacterium]|jgi:hypothetical protein|nr:hypothetical protein [Planctomycetaceae bacterium]